MTADSSAVVKLAGGRIFAQGSRVVGRRVGTVRDLRFAPRAWRVHAE
jgi:hypothetical protein